MSTEPIAQVFIYIGVIGVLQFASLAFAARQLQGVTTVHLRHRLSSPVTRHAQPLAMLSAVLLLVGIVLQFCGTA